MRGTAAAGILLVFGLALLVIGFTGRLGVVLAAVLAPAQVVTQ